MTVFELSFSQGICPVVGLLGHMVVLSTDEWIKKMWHIYTMEYFSAIKRNEIELFVVRWT